MKPLHKHPDQPSVNGRRTHSPAPQQPAVPAPGRAANHATWPKLLLLAVLFIPVALFAQKWESATTLTGSVHVQAIFVDTQEDSWSAADKERFVALTKRNMWWLHGEAWNRGVRFTFTVDTTSVPPLPQVLLARFNSEYLLIIHPMVRRNPERYFASFGADNLVLIFFVATKERSFAVSAADSHYPLEFCVIFKEDEIPFEYRDSVIAHEVLHLFGAEDLYDYNDPEAQAALKERYGNEVMHILGWLPELSISGRTAKSIGWLPKEGGRWWGERVEDE